MDHCARIKQSAPSTATGDPVAVGQQSVRVPEGANVVAIVVIVAAVVASVRCNPDGGRSYGSRRSVSAVAIVAVRITSHGTITGPTATASNGITRTAGPAGDGVHRARASGIAASALNSSSVSSSSAVTAAVKTSGSHSASVKPSAAPEPTATTATGQSIVRDQARADQHDYAKAERK
jgi:hypothetical protein